MIHKNSHIQFLFLNTQRTEYRIMKEYTKQPPCSVICLVRADIVHLRAQSQVCSFSKDFRPSAIHNLAADDLSY